jgi:BASS family bile acid:Na+ symporter
MYKRITSAIAISSGVLAIILLTLGDFDKLGPVLILFFLSLALAIRNVGSLRGFSFTVIIFAAVAASMFYPDFFSKAGDFDLKKLIVPLLMIIMFGMGTAMSLEDFKGVAKMPKGVLVGIICQFSIMPFVGYGLATVFGFPPEIAAGIILVGSSPSGLASNVMAYISGANLALSLTLTAVATLLAPLFTPLLMKALANQLVPIDFLGMLWSIVKIVIIPIIAGLVFNRFAHGRFKWLDKAMPVFSMAGIAIIITIITAAGRDSLLTLGLLLIVAVILHNIIGYFFGYWGSRVFGLDRKSARTVAFEVGMQNSGLGVSLATQFFSAASALPGAIFSIVHNISGVSLANWWGRRKSDIPV